MDNEKKVGIIKSDGKKNNKKPPEKFFRDAANIWIKIYGDVMPLVNGEKCVPCFWNDGAEKSNLKNILRELRERAELKNVLWTLEEMKKRFELFLLKAFDDQFISANFMLRIINNNKTKIFNNQITPKLDGRKNNFGRTQPTPVITTKPKGGFGKL